MADKIRAVIFDMGGVLLKTVNSEPRKALAKRFGTNRSELETVVFLSETSTLSEVGKISDKEHWKSVFNHFNQDFDNYLPVYDEYFSGDAIDEKLLSYAASLKPTYKLGLLSNAWMNARTLLRARFDFIDVFDVSIFSYEVGCRKPDLQIYQKMLDRLNVKADESIFIDDMPANIDGAKLAGMHALQFISTEDLIITLTELLN